MVKIVDLTDKPYVGICELAIGQGECEFGNSGQLVVRTGEHTGRAADRKFVVTRNLHDSTLGGAAGKPLDGETFDELFRKNDPLNERFGMNRYSIDFTAFGTKVRLFSRLAWHAAFVSKLFTVQRFTGEPDLTIVD